MSGTSRMKRLAYVSTLNVGAGDSKFSSELMKILNTAREFNARNNITGVLLTSGNTVFQMLEGDSAALAPLMYKIGKDARHKDVSIVLNSRTEKRLFENWNMRLLVKGSLMHGQVVRRIQAEVKEGFSGQSALDNSRLSAIFTKPVEPTKRDQPLPATLPDVQYEQQVLSMSSWPRPNQIRITGEIVDLCSNLVGKQRGYSELKSVSRCKTDEQLLRCLTAVDNIGLLKKQTTIEPNVETLAAVSKPGKDRFSQVLRKFITSARN